MGWATRRNRLSTNHIGDAQRTPPKVSPCGPTSYYRVTSLHIPVDAFFTSWLIICHLCVYAFPGVCPRFCHTSQTRTLSRDSTFPLLLWCARIGMSAASIRRGTRVSALYRGGGGVHSVLSTINSTVFSLCRNSASYLKRTHSRASPYFSRRFLVPCCPGLRISRVFT